MDDLAEACAVVALAAGMLLAMMAIPRAVAALVGTLMAALVLAGGA